MAATGAAKCAGMMRRKGQLLAMSSTHRRVCSHPAPFSSQCCSGVGLLQQKRREGSPTSSGELEKTSFFSTGDTSSFRATAAKLGAGCSRL